MIFSDNTPSQLELLYMYSQLEMLVQAISFPTWYLPTKLCYLLKSHHYVSISQMEQHNQFKAKKEPDQDFNVSSWK
jgi:hypothetical protein